MLLLQGTEEPVDWERDAGILVPHSSLQELWSIGAAVTSGDDVAPPCRPPAVIEAIHACTTASFAMLWVAALLAAWSLANCEWGRAAAAAAATPGEAGAAESLALSRRTTIKKMQLAEAATVAH